MSVCVCVWVEREKERQGVGKLLRLLLLLLLKLEHIPRHRHRQGQSTRERHSRTSLPPLPLKPSHISLTQTHNSTYPLNEPSIPLRPAIRGHNTIERTVVTPKALQAEADHHGVVLCLCCVC